MNGLDYLSLVACLACLAAYLVGVDAGRSFGYLSFHFLGFALNGWFVLAAVTS